VSGRPQPEETEPLGPPDDAEPQETPPDEGAEPTADAPQAPLGEGGSTQVDQAEAPSGSLAEPRGTAGGPGLSFGFNLGKVAGQGEDSDPILRDGRELGLVAVFDGMGGAGGTVYETPDGPRSGAYLASRLARDVVEQRMVALLDPKWNLNGPATAAELKRVVRSALQARLTELKAPASGLRSRLLRALPTTMALAALQRREPDGDRWACHLLWAGDSRIYLLRPETGAQQLTVDDIRDRGDAMANLREDSVVSNAISADTEFVVHHRKVELTTPFLVVAATDGCFGYVPSPMHFEHLVLAALRDAADTDSWSAAVQAAIGAVTGDDAAMAVLGVGADHDTFRELFRARTAELEQRWIAPLDEADADLRRRERELDESRTALRVRQAQLWAAYKPGYEQHLAPAATQETQ
jgi:serine/threonine protein phosphatase PrpC